MKRRVATGETTASTVVLENPWHAESMSISELLMSQRRWGRARCRRLLLSLGIPENKRLGTLTDRQRHMLADTLNTKSEPAPHAGLAPTSRAITRTLSAVQA
jgi:hypothetical protein